jgi:WD40 repeat protein
LACGSGSDHSTIRIWNLDNYECISILNGHSDIVSSLEYISDNRLASASEDKTIKIWNLNDNSLINTLEGHTYPLACLKRISDNQLASGDGLVNSEDDCGIIKIWNTDYYSCNNTFNSEHIDWIACMILISNNRLITCGDGEKTIKVWNMNDNSLIKTLAKHKEHILCLMSLENGSRLVSISSDETYKLWDMDNYSCIKTVRLK